MFRAKSAAEVVENLSTGITSLIDIFQQKSKMLNELLLFVAAFFAFAGLLLRIVK